MPRWMLRTRYLRVLRLLYMFRQMERRELWTKRMSLRIVLGSCKPRSHSTHSCERKFSWRKTRIHRMLLKRNVQQRQWRMRMLPWLRRSRMQKNNLPQRLLRTWKMPLQLTDRFHYQVIHRLQFTRLGFYQEQTMCLRCWVHWRRLFHENVSSRR